MDEHQVLQNLGCQVAPPRGKRPPSYKPNFFFLHLLAISFSIWPYFALPFSTWLRRTPKVSREVLMRCSWGAEPPCRCNCIGADNLGPWPNFPSLSQYGGDWPSLATSYRPSRPACQRPRGSAQVPSCLTWWRCLCDYGKPRQTSWLAGACPVQRLEKNTIPNRLEFKGGATELLACQGLDLSSNITWICESGTTLATKVR